MGRDNLIAGEFLGSCLLTASATLITLLKIDGADFALAVCLSYAILVYALKSLEDTNLNPALTLGDIFTKRLPVDKGVLTILAQFAGATLGAVAVSLLAQDASGVPSASEGQNLKSVFATQLAFGTCLVFGNIRGFWNSRSRPIWLGVFSYGAYLCGCCTASCLNPAVAFAADISRASNQMKVDGMFLTAFVLLPMLAAGLGMLLERIEDNNLLMTELTGTFFLCLGLFCAASGQYRTKSAIGVALFTASIVRAFATSSGGLTNPAISIGATVLGTKFENAIMTAFFQLGGGALAAVAAQQALGISLDIAVNQDFDQVLISSAYAALLMACFALTFNGAFGTPATPLIGVTYAASFATSALSLAINPAASFGAIITTFLTKGSLSASTFIVPVVPIGAAALSAALIKLAPSDYRRSV